MKLPVYDKEGKQVGEMDLPPQFSEAVRPDLITRAVQAVQANRRQPYGASPEAGKRASAKLSRRRHDYRGSYGFGISRVPRKIMSARGTRFNWVGAFAPGTVGGRRAHPPKSSKVWAHKINTKERRKAIRSALSACLDPEQVKGRGHKVPKNYPFVLSDSFNDISKTSPLKEALAKLGLEEELARISERKIRSGRGSMRGRKYAVKKGPLLVTGKESALYQAAGNILGVDTVEVHSINAEILAPGKMPGRMVLFTQQALATLAEEELFTDHPNIKKDKPKKAAPLKPKKPEEPKAKQPAKKESKKEPKPQKQPSEKEDK